MFKNKTALQGTPEEDFAWLDEPLEMSDEETPQTPNVPGESVVAVAASPTPPPVHVLETQQAAKKEDMQPETLMKTLFEAVERGNATGLILDKVKTPHDIEKALPEIEDRFKTIHASMAPLHGQGSVELSKQDAKRKKAYEDALASNGIDPKSYLGQLFRNEKGNTEEYKSANREKKEEIRQDWLKSKMKEFTERHTYTKSYRKVDWQKGTYLPLGMVVKKEGGWKDPAAVEGALTLCSRAIALGPPWLQTNFQTGRMTYLYFEIGFNEQFEEAWGLFRTEMLSGKITTSSAPPDAKQRGGQADPTDGDPIGAVNHEEPPKDDDPPQDPKDNSAKPKPKPKPDTKNDPKKLWSAALGCRKTVMETTARAHNLVAQIAEEVAWQWANNAGTKGEIEKN